ncbi:T9SS type A sorting domain-containing protein [Adhaeribacter radiodurans]|uniref:T9SS type A sorting domain-containing protein n=1 Tax=Adhaeribacter radiodurans TaxID=2745197 RepID=A0A7L7LEE8_9BACT|nr:T9SS type A sorting domain-containing protein [Adhaeribacter radiodurans]QMU31044.1 T9SS type A sorting domain-containing protein [Adhaeribacter radiodurans]
MKKPLSNFSRVSLTPVLAPRWRGFSVILLLLLTLPVLTFAQNKIWDKTIGSSDWDVLSSIQQTQDGGYILGGYSGSNISEDKSQNSRGGDDFWVVKLNASGAKVWDRTLGGTSDDFLTSIQQTSDGGYILGGRSQSGIGGNKSQASKGEWDYWVVKLAANGTKAWDKTLGGSGNDYLYSVRQTSDGGYILGGWSDSGIGGNKTQANKGESDYWVVKLNANGSQLWDKTFGGNQADELAALEQTNDGGYILGGFSSSGISGDKSQNSRGFKDYWVIKISANGNKSWDRTYGGASDDNLTSLHQTNDGGYILGGSSYSEISGEKSQANKGDTDYWVIKIGANGTKAWDKTYGGNQADDLAALQQTSDGGYVLGGTSRSGLSGDKSQTSKGIEDFWVVKLKANGSKFWERTLGGSPNPNPLASLQQTSDGNYILGGSSINDASGDKSEDSKGSNDYWIVKLDNSNTNISQTINFKPIPYKSLGDAPFALSATATSGLPVSFSVVSGPATINNNMVTVTGLGEVTIKAYQAGNANYLPAEATRTFLVRNDIQKPWDKTFGGTNLDKLTAMVATEDGGYLLGGSSLSGISGNKTQANRGREDYWLVKTDKQGKKLWDNSYGGKGVDNLTSILATPDGGYLLGGSSASGISGDRSQVNRGGTDYWVVKIDSEGNKLWDKAYGGNMADNLTVLLATADGNYLLGGASTSGVTGDKSQASKGDTDYWVIKINEDGDKLWDRSYGGNKADELAAIVASDNGGYLLGGSSASGISGNKSQTARAKKDYWVVRIQENGAKIWDKTFGGSLDAFEQGGCDPSTGEDCNFYFGESILSSLVATPDGGFLLGGSSNANQGAEKSEDNLGGDEYSYFIKSYWVVMIDQDGQKVWDKTYQGISDAPSDGQGWFFVTGNSILNKIVPMADGDYLLAGTSNGSKGASKSEDPRFEDPESPARDDYWVIKIDGEGTKKWDRVVGGFSNDFLADIVPAGEGEYVLGGSSASGIGADKSQANWDPSGNYYQRSDYWIVKIKVEEQPLSAQWNNRYGGAGNDAFTVVIKTADGGYLSGGYTNSGISGDKSQSSRGLNDYWIVKSNAAGKKLWDKRFGGTGDDYLNTIIQTSDGGFLLGGSSLSEVSGDKTQASRGNRDFWIVKISSTGIKQWDKRYGGSGYDELKKVLQLSNDEYVLAGLSNSPVSGDKTQASRGGQDFWVVKISGNGTKIWDKRYGGSLNENLEGLALTLDGGYLLGGSSYSGISGDKTQNSRGGSDYWVIRVNSAGTKVWDKRFGGSGEDNLMDLGSTGTNTGNFFIAGHSTSGAEGDRSQNSQGGKDFWMLKINASGDKLFDKRFGGSSDEGLRTILLTSDGGYLLAGRSESDQSGDKTQGNQGSSDYWIVKTTSTGEMLWDKRFGGNGYDEIRTAAQTEDGGFILGGRSDSDASGDRTQPSQGGYDYWLVKVAPQNSPIIAERQVAPVVPATVQEATLDLLKAYPNPFREKVKVNFTLPQTQPASVKVYDNQGREITTLFQGEAKADQKYEVEWQASNKAAGMYFLQLQTPTTRQQQKILLTK